MCRKIPHVTGRKHDQLWCLILGPMNLHVMGSFQYRLWSSPLVPIWIALPGLPAVGLIGKRQVSPMCVSLLEKLELNTINLLIWRLSVFSCLQDVLLLACLPELERPQNGTHKIWTQSGGVEYEDPTT